MEVETPEPPGMIVVAQVEEATMLRKDMETEIRPRS